MENSIVAALIIGFMVGVGSTLAYMQLQRPKPKPTQTTPPSDGLEGDFHKVAEDRNKILKDYPLTHFIAAAVVLIVLVLVLGALLFGSDKVLDYAINVYVAVVGTGVTVFVIDRLNRRRDEQQAERDLKAQLLRDVRSRVAHVAARAIHEMREHNWLEGEDGLLRGADLYFADLSDAILGGANLKDANLLAAKLKGASLVEANLSGANLFGADLENAFSWELNLSGANLTEANLKGADLTDADLSNAILKNVTYDETTTLPDGKKWTSETDMTRFTDTQYSETLWSIMARM